MSSDDNPQPRTISCTCLVIISLLCAIAASTSLQRLFISLIPWSVVSKIRKRSDHSCRRTYHLAMSLRPVQSWWHRYRPRDSCPVHTRRTFPAQDPFRAQFSGSSEKCSAHSPPTLPPDHRCSEKSLEFVCLYPGALKLNPLKW